MKDFLSRVLDPLGPLSPLHPRHPLNPLRPRRARRPPPVELGDEHNSLLAVLYDDATTLDRVPFPNMEWWWNAVECTAKQTKPKGAAGLEFSIITSVHLYALPLLGLVAQATIAIRRLKDGRTFQVSSPGEVLPDASCRFEAPGWSAQRATNRYEFHVATEELSCDLTFTDRGTLAFFGDPGTLGWYDNNPTGFIPYWASYRSRFGRPSGTFRLVTDGKELEYEIDSEDDRGHVRFDHQSLHWSLEDIGGPSLPIFAEALITRPSWKWIHARIGGGGAEPEDLMAYELRNGHTGKVLKRVAALSSETAGARAAFEDGLLFREKRKQRDDSGEHDEPEQTIIEFDVLPPEKPGGKKRPSADERADRYVITLTPKRDVDSIVEYPVAGKLCYRAKEVYATVKGSVTRADGSKTRLEGTGVREEFDLITSLRVKL